jgi:hypothetical protein
MCSFSETGRAWHADSSRYFLQDHGNSAAIIVGLLVVQPTITLSLLAFLIFLDLLF